MNPIRQAFILGAGLGTRLRRLTETLPKPLIPVAGRPLITYGLDHLLGLGVEKVVINTHHRAEAYERAFPEHRYRHAELIFSHEPELLETGGGLKAVETHLRNGPFVVYNGDILCDLPLRNALTAHIQRRHEVTLVLRSGGGPLQIALGPCDRVRDIGGRLGWTGVGERYLFTGISIMQPGFLYRLEKRKVSVIETFLKMIREDAMLGGVVIDQGYWGDLGTRESYLDAHRQLRKSHPRERWIAPDAEVAEDAWLGGATYVGSRAVVGPGARLVDTILWPGARVAPGASLERCVVTENQKVDGTHADEDF